MLSAFRAFKYFCFLRKHTVWHSSRSCCSTWAVCDSRGVWQTHPLASAGPWWRSGEHPASRRGPPTSRSRYCHRHTHTHTHRSEDKGHPDEEREGGRGCVWGEGVCCGRCGGGGCCSSTPGHSPILFRPYTDCYVPNVCLISCLFGCFWTVSVWMQRSRRGFKCNKSITMLQSMIIDWKVKWPHAGKVTADTAANHTVSRQRSGGRGMEKWGRACKNKRKKKKRKKEHLWSTEWKRKKENLQIDFPSSQALSQHPSMSPGWWGPWKSYQTNHADLLGQPE